jgi:hypothetical protein
VKSESPVPIANVVMKLRSYASSIASTAILMSAAFLSGAAEPLRDLDELDHGAQGAHQPSVLRPNADPKNSPAYARRATTNGPQLSGL